MEAEKLKLELLSICTGHVDTRYLRIKKTISEIVDALKEESKSSAGDKHETGRAMLQIERENAGVQLREIEALQLLLQRIDVTAISDIVHLGSLVITNQGTYFLSVSIGAIELDNRTYYCVALKSPIGELLFGKRKNDRFLFNKKELKITEVI